MPSSAGALGERGLIDLPAPRRRVRFSGSSFARTQLKVPSRLEGSVKELRGLKLVSVTSKDRELDLQWKKLVATHHYSEIDRCAAHNCVT